MNADVSAGVGGTDTVNQTSVTEPTQSTHHKGTVWRVSLLTFFIVCISKTILQLL